jgi:hypothetical protein
MINKFSIQALGEQAANLFGSVWVKNRPNAPRKLASNGKVHNPKVNNFVRLLLWVSVLICLFPTLDRWLASWIQSIVNLS